MNFGTGNHCDRRIAGLLVCSLVLTAALYSIGLSGPFIYDDAHNLAPVLSWDRDITPWQDVVFGNDSGTLGRPVAMLSFLASGMIGVSPFHFKLGNLIIHLATGAVAWIFLRQLLRGDPRVKSHADILATIIVAIWLVHPMFASTVLYAVQRMAQLSALFTIAALACYLRARSLLATGERQHAMALLFLAVPCLFLLGILSKENAAIAPLLCLLIEVIYPANAAARSPVRWFLLVFAVLPAAAAVCLLLTAPERLLSAYDQRAYTLFERLITQSNVLLEYIGQLLFPRGETMTVYTDGYPVTRDFLRPATNAIGALVLLSATTAAWMSRRAVPLVTFGWLFFLVAHAVESTILPLDLYYDHRNYLPAFGLFAAAAALVWELFGANPHRRPVWLTAVACMTAVGLLASSLVQRTIAWSSRPTLIEEALTHHPESLRAQLAQLDDDHANGNFTAIIRRLADMELSDSLQWRLVSRIEALRLDCSIGKPVSAVELDRATRERPRRLTNDDVHSIKLLLQMTHSGQCGAFDDFALGSTLAQLADHATLQHERSAPKWQTRYAASLAFARSGFHDKALQQAAIAWSAGATLDVGFMVVWNQMKLGRAQDARTTAEQMQSRLPRFSRAAKRELGKAYLVLKAP